MRIALFITCFNDTIFPADRPRDGAAAGAARPQGRFPAGADLLRADALQHRLPARGHPAGAPLCRGLRAAEMVVAPSASCVGMVRDFYARAAEDAATARSRRRWRARPPRVFELSEFLVKQLGVEDVGAYYPHRVTYHPTCHSLRMLHVGDAPLRLLRAVRGIDLVELPNADSAAASAAPSRSRTPTPRWRCSSDKLRCILRHGAEVCARPITRA